MNWSLVDFLVMSPWWFVVLWVLLIVFSLTLLWQWMKERDDA